MSEEPFFIRQTEAPKTENERLAWLEERVSEAKSEGASFSRFSRHPVRTHVLLFEAWKERPDDQGAQRFDWGSL